MKTQKFTISTVRPKTTTCAKELGELIGGIDVEAVAGPSLALGQPLVEAEDQLPGQEYSRLQVGVTHLKYGYDGD
jgi:hypothetical protein